MGRQPVTDPKRDPQRGAPRQPRPKAGPIRSNPVRPNPGRMLLYVVATMAAILAGYAAGLLLTGTDRPPPSSLLTPAAPTARIPGLPWYQTQGAPPGMIRMADAPIFPDALDETPAHPVLPYEEALPAEVHAPPVTAVPPPGKPMPRPTTPAAIPAIVLKPPLEGLPPWRRYAVAAPPDDGRAKVVVVIDDLGIDKRRTTRMMEFAAPLTLSFLSYASDLEQMTRTARARGHELLVHMPMEPSSRQIDPGPNVLLTGLQKEELLKRVRWALGQFDSYIGVNNHMGSKFTANAEGMAVVLAELKGRGLMFLDSRTTGGTTGPRLAHDLGIPFAERNVFLDNENDVAAVARQLAELEAIAKKHGHAIAIGHPRDATIAVLETWLPSLAARGLQLVPLSAVTRE